MRGLWILVGAVLLAAVAWWLVAGPSPTGNEDPVADDPAANEAGPRLMGRARAHPAAALEGVLEGHEVLRGSVEDTEGKLLPGIAVQLDKYVEREFLDAAPGRWLETEASGHPEPYELVATTRTAEDGTFSFCGLPEAGGSYRVSAGATPPWTPVTRHTGFLRNNSFVRLVLGKGDLLRLRVVDGDGAGLHAYVTCWREREGVDWHASGFEGLPTSADGRLTASLPDGAFRCSVHVPGVGRRSGVLVETPQSREVVIPVVIRGGAVVAGTVSDTSGKPVAGARILVVSGNEPDAAVSRLTTSGADGTYRVVGLMPGPLQTLGVAAAGFVTVDGYASGRELIAGADTRIDVTMIRGGVLEGTVRGPTGRVIAGALVHARAERAREGLAGSDRAVTDNGGRYRMTEVPLGAGHVRVSAPGLYQPDASKGWYVVEGESDRRVVDVTMACGIPVVGRVVDTAGRSVAGAGVLANGNASEGSWSSSRENRSTLTDRDGRFAYPGLPPSKAWRLTAQTEIALSEPVLVATPRGQSPPAPVEIVLRPGAVVEGRVVRGDAAVTDLLRVHAGGKGSGSKTVAVRADGTFRIAGLQPGEYELRVVNWNFDRISKPLNLTLAWGEVQKDVVLEMERFGRIAGVVVDGRGDPVPGLRLRLDVSVPGHHRSLDATSNLRGRFEFTAVPDNGYAFTLLIQSERQPGTHTPGDTDLRLVYEPLASVRFEGTVLLPDGTPAVTGRVMLWEVTPSGGRNGRTVPISNGEFGQSFQRLSRDTTFAAEVREVFDVLGHMVSIQPLTIEPVEPGAPIEFRLVAGLEIQGVVVDADGAPAPGVWVSLVPKGERVPFRHKNMQSRADGSFQFGSLSPGAMEVRVERVPPPWIAPQPVPVQAGNTNVRVELLRGGAIKGIVFGADGQPLGAVITWRPAGGKTVTTSSGEDGRFTLFPIPPGIPGSVTAAPPSNAGVPMVAASASGIRAGAVGIELLLQPGAYIEGEVSGPDGEAVAGAFLACDSMPGSQSVPCRGRLEGGTRFKIGPVHPGRYVLRVHVGGEYVAPDPVEVLAPTEGVRIVVPKGLSIKGTLAGAEKPERYSVAFMRMTRDGPSTLGGVVTPSGQFLLTMKADDVGVLYFHDREGGDLYGLLERVRPSATSLTVSLQKGETIEGRFHPYAKDDEGYVYIQTPSGFNLAGQVAKDGTFVVRGVPPGIYEVRGFTKRRQCEPLTGVRAGTRGHVLR